MKRLIVALLALGLATPAWAVSNRVLDAQQITNGAFTLTVPAVTDTLTTATNTQTFSNKSISGSSNTLSNIPVSALATGTAIGVAIGGTGLTTATANGMLYGNGTSALGVTAAGSQYQVFQAGASGVPTVAALALGQSAAVTGQLGVANGGTGASSLTSGSVVVGNGTSAVSLVAPSTSGNVLTSNGTTWISSAPSMFTPAVNGGSSSAQSVTAAGGVSLSGIGYSNFVWVAGSSGAVTVTKTPSVTACTADGQQLTIIGTSNTNTVTLQDSGTLSGSGLRLNGQWVGAQYSALFLVCNFATTEWFEVSRR